MLRSYSEDCIDKLSLTSQKEALIFTWARPIAAYVSEEALAESREGYREGGSFNNIKFAPLWGKPIDLAKPQLNCEYSYPLRKYALLLGPAKPLVAFSLSSESLYGRKSAESYKIFLAQKCSFDFIQSFPFFGSSGAKISLKASGDLLTLLKAKKTLPMTTIINITTQLVLALYALHSKMVVHLDIKTNNFLFHCYPEIAGQEEFIMKLSDPDTMWQVDEKGHIFYPRTCEEFYDRPYASFHRDCIGNPDWTPPEVSGFIIPTRKSEEDDIGTPYEDFCRTTNFFLIDCFRLSKILSGNQKVFGKETIVTPGLKDKICPEEKIDPDISTAFRQLYLGLGNPDPKLRWSIHQAMQSPLFGPTAEARERLFANLRIKSQALCRFKIGDRECKESANVDDFSLVEPFSFIKAKEFKQRTLELLEKKSFDSSCREKLADLFKIAEELAQGIQKTLLDIFQENGMDILAPPRSSHYHPELWPNQCNIVIEFLEQLKANLFSYGTRLLEQFGSHLDVETCRSYQKILTEGLKKADLEAHCLGIADAENESAALNAAAASVAQVGFFAASGWTTAHVSPVTSSRTSAVPSP